MADQPTTPGFYPDPYLRGWERFWDGQSWTVERREIAESEPSEVQQSTSHEHLEPPDAGSVPLRRDEPRVSHGLRSSQSVTGEQSEDTGPIPRALIVGAVVTVAALIVMGANPVVKDGHWLVLVLLLVWPAAVLWTVTPSRLRKLLRAFAGSIVFFGRPRSASSDIGPAPTLQDWRHRVFVAGAWIGALAVLMAMTRFGPFAWLVAAISFVLILYGAGHRGLGDYGMPAALTLPVMAFILPLWIWATGWERAAADLFCVIVGCVAR